MQRGHKRHSDCLTLDLALKLPGEVTAVGQNNPKDVHILILGTCEYVTFSGRRDVADVIKRKILR